MNKKTGIVVTLYATLAVSESNMKSGVPNGSTSIITANSKRTKLFCKVKILSGVKTNLYVLNAERLSMYLKKNWGTKTFPSALSFNQVRLFC